MPSTRKSTGGSSKGGSSNSKSSSGRGSSRRSSAPLPAPTTTTTTTTNTTTTTSSSSSSSSRPRTRSNSDASKSRTKTKTKPTTPKSSSSKKQKQQPQSQPQLDAVLQRSLPDHVQQFCLEVGVLDHQQFLDSRPKELGDRLQNFLLHLQVAKTKTKTTTPSLKNPSSAISNYKSKIKKLLASGIIGIGVGELSGPGPASNENENDDDDDDDDDMEEEQEEENSDNEDMEDNDDEEEEQQEEEEDGEEDEDGDDDYSQGAYTTTTTTTTDRDHLHRLYDSTSVVPSYTKKQKTGSGNDNDEEENDDDQKSNNSSSSKGKSKTSSKASSKVLKVNEDDDDDDDDDDEPAIKESNHDNHHAIVASESAVDDDHMDLLSNVGGRRMEIGNDDDDDDDGDDEDEKPSGPSKFDVHVHRVRHLKYMPQAIVSIASNDYGGYVAVSRADGSIELNVMGTIRKADADDDHHGNNKNTTLRGGGDWEPTTNNHNNDKGRYVPHLQPVSKVHGAALIEASPPRRNDHDHDRPKPSAAVAADRMVWVPVGHKGQSRVLVATNYKFASVWAVDFEHSKNRSNFISGGGSVYDLSVCLDCNNELPLVAGSCKDGKIRVWRVEKSKGKLPKIYETPVFVVPIPGGSPIVSLTWRCTDEPSTSQDGKKKTFNTVFFAAVADGTIRKCKVDFVREKKSDDELNDDDSHYVRYFAENYDYCLRMTVESKGRKNPTIVWDMKLLSDGTLVTCNSLGQVQMWDSREGILLQTIDQADKGNHVHAFALAVNKSETKIFCSGIDPVVVAIERLKTGMDNEWKKAGKYRPHSHDVRALAVVDALIPQSTAACIEMADDDDRVLETLVSGGIDTRLCGYDAEAFTSKRPREWRPWPTDSPISTTFGNDQMRLLAFRRLNSIELFQFDKKSNFTADSSNGVSPSSGTSVQRRVKTLRNAECIGEIFIKLGDDGTNEVRTTATQLQASQISPNGRWLVASNAAASFLYYLNSTSDHGSLDEGSYDTGDLKIVPKKIQFRKLPPSTVFHFRKNVLFLVDANRRQVLMIQLTESEEKRQSPHAAVCPSKLILPEPIGHRTKMILPVHDIKSSRDGKYVATMTHQDGKQAICIFCDMDRTAATSDVPNYQPYWTIPSLGKNSRPAAITFVGNTHLAVATYQSHVYVFDLVHKCPSPWSEKNGFPTIRPNRWTNDLLCRYDFPVRLSVDPSDEGTLIMSSFETVCLIKLNRRMPKLCVFLPVHHLRGRKKRKLPQLQQSENGNDAPEEEWLLQPYASERATGEIVDNHNDADEEEQEGKSPIYLRYKGILHVDFFSKKEMVVVEELWTSVNELLPNPLKRSVYGHGV